ncbi:MAG: hypothetical protein LBH79_07045 [Nitrososphaerota archaeon]|nr:hypothetical protein [Nitrososphaerota archaeon]
MKQYYVWCECCGRLSSGRLIEINSKVEAKKIFRRFQCSHHLKDVRCIDGANVKLTL